MIRANRRLARAYRRLADAQLAVADAQDGLTLILDPVLVTDGNWQILEYPPEADEP